MQSSIRGRIRGGLGCAIWGCTRAAGGSASLGRMEELRGLEVPEARLTVPWREAQ